MNRVIKVFKFLRRFFYSSLFPVKYAKSIGVKIGSGVRIYSLHPSTFGSEPYLITLGNDVVITDGVRFITHDGSTFLFRKKHPDIDVMGPITIDDNTFIGIGSIILPGVSIGKNCIIGAMSVVSSPIPDNVVAAGNPAKAIGSTDDFLKKLLLRSCKTGHLNTQAKRRRLEQLPRTKDSRGRNWISYF